MAAGIRPFVVSISFCIARFGVWTLHRLPEVENFTPGLQHLVIQLESIGQPGLERVGALEPVLVALIQIEGDCLSEIRSVILEMLI